MSTLAPAPFNSRSARNPVVLPDLTGATRIEVRFKEEEDDHGAVTILDLDVAEAWKAAQGGPIPFGAKADGVCDLDEQAWLSRADAVKIAKLYGTTMIES